MTSLFERGISTRPATHAVHMLEYYKNKYLLKPEDYPNAFIADRCSISFPLFDGLKDDEQEYIIEEVKKIINIMCGIAGFVDFKGSKIDITLLKKATDAISHRGPDGEGHWIEDNIGIGHRRLSIIDLSDLASQPMVSKDQRYVLSYNGEIYNFKELRNELKNNNVIFHSESDTEVVLNSLSFWGSEALNKFNGMFALAFFDRKSKELLLARDRYGIKPLYYSEQNNFFSFCF